MKTATKTIDLNGIEIAIPVGSMDKPSELTETIMKAAQDPRGWKYPIRPFVTTNKGLAEDYAYCLNWYVGGHEMIETWTTDGTQYIVSSLGYYHYVGA